jgi:UDP-N-acetyl-D-mannosaminuronate dehydrogenase
MLSPGSDHSEVPVDAVAGFIGLGTMGSAMSAHLLAAGFAVTGYDIEPARLAAHAGRGGLTAADPAGTAARADVVVTSLPTAAALIEVVTATAGLAAVTCPTRSAGWTTGTGCARRRTAVPGHRRPTSPGSGTTR